MLTLISDMKLAADAIEHLACEMPPPNAYTPRFMSLVVTMRQLITEAEMRRLGEQSFRYRGCQNEPLG